VRELNVLFVDDDPDDVALERASLRGDFTLRDTVVDSPDGFSTALTSGAFDIVLCDYSMPRLGGMDALHMWQQSGVDVPFIFVTGRLSEDVAVECIKAGATDYVLKGNLARLPAAVDRALREYEAAREFRRTEAERARVVAAVEQSHEAVVITDREGVILYVNPAFTLTNGFTLEEALGQTPRIMKSGRHDDAFYAEMWRQILAGQPWNGQIVNKRRDGSFYDCEVAITPVLDAHGHIVNFCGIQRDVSERVAAERELRHLHDELAETDRLKDQFLAAFSHELRTPLNVILGYADILHETVGETLDADSQRFLERIIWGASHLTALINETLDLARLRMDAIRPILRNADVAALVADTAEGFVPMAAAKQLDFVYPQSSEPVPALTDPDRVRQIISNLLDNAIKFTDRGGIRVSLEATPDTVTIDVADTGIGIQSTDQARIFEDFRQADGSATRVHGGCGLGLSLCRRLVSMLGGTIAVDSTPGQGSTFHVRLPRTTETPATD